MGTCGTLQLTYGLGQDANIFTFMCELNGDEIVLHKASGRIVVYELMMTTMGGLKLS